MRLFALIIFSMFLLVETTIAQTKVTSYPDKSSLHGMMFFGGKKSPSVYASHLPMFHTPHDYQIILEVEIADEARAAYQKSLRTNPKETVYTLVPEVFVLPEMLDNPRPFKAEIYTGHFERGGKPITGKLPVSIKRVIYRQKFDTAAKRPKTASYLVFGNNKEQFAAHTITAKPDFDQIVSLRNCPIAEESLKSSNYTVCSLAEQNRPLKKGNFSAQTSVNAGKMLLKFDKTLYLEFDDLQ